MNDLISYRSGAYILFIAAIFCLLDIIFIIGTPITVVLLFHEVFEDKTDEFGIDEPVLRTKIQEFLDNGFKPVTPQDFEIGLNEGFKMFSKNFLVTFDDGKQTSADTAKMLKNEYGISSALFLITDGLNKTPMHFTEQTAIELQNNYGCLIGLHGKSHKEATKILENGEDLTSELKNAASFLSKIIKRPVTWYAYPFGENNENTRKCVIDAGFSQVFTIESDIILEKTDRYKIPRIMYSRHAPDNGLADMSNYAKLKYNFYDFRYHITAILFFITIGIIYLRIAKKKQNSL